MARSDQVFHLRELEQSFGYSQAVKVGGTLYISGSVSWDQDGKVLAAGDMAAQMRNAFDDIRQTLEAHGATFENVVKETIFTTDMDAAVEASSIRSEFYGDYGPPAATWVEVSRLVYAELLIEVEIIAELP